MRGIGHFNHVGGLAGLAGRRHPLPARRFLTSADHQAKDLCLSASCRLIHNAMTASGDGTLFVLRLGRRSAGISRLRKTHAR